MTEQPVELRGGQGRVQPAAVAGGRAGVDTALALTAELDSAGSSEDVSRTVLRRIVESASADTAALCRIERGEVIAGPMWSDGRIDRITSRAPLTELPALAAVASGRGDRHWPTLSGLLPDSAVDRLAPTEGVAAVPIHFGGASEAAVVIVVGRRSGQALSDIEVESIRIIGSIGVTILQAQRLRAAAENALRTKGEFLALVAHELRSPVGVIAGYLAMLREGSLGAVPERWQRPLATMEAKLGEVNATIEDLLSASRLENATPSSNRQRVDLRTVVIDAVARAEPRAGLLGASLDTVVPDAAVTVDVDSRQVLRVLDNLINNAFNYSQGKPWVEVALTVTPMAAEVRVSDHGVGIPKRVAQRIFERFDRGGRPTRPHSGSGLGLAIAREMAELNGGRLLLDHSVVGKGSRFLLRLPLAQASG